MSWHGRNPAWGLRWVDLQLASKVYTCLISTRRNPRGQRDSRLPQDGGRLEAYRSSTQSRVIDALAKYGVASIDQEQVLSTPHLEVWGKVEKTWFLSKFSEFPQITLGWYVVFLSTYHPRLIWGNSENLQRNHIFSTFPHTWRWGIDNTCCGLIGATPWSAKASIQSRVILLNLDCVGILYMNSHRHKRFRHYTPWLLCRGLYGWDKRIVKEKR